MKKLFLLFLFIAIAISAYSDDLELWIDAESNAKWKIKYQIFYSVEEWSNGENSWLETYGSGLKTVPLGEVRGWTSLNLIFNNLSEMPDSEIPYYVKCYLRIYTAQGIYRVVITENMEFNLFFNR